MGTFYCVMSGAMVRQDLTDLHWQAGLYLTSADPTVFNAHGAFTAATEALWNGTGGPDDGLVVAYSNLVKLQRTQTYDFAPSTGLKGLNLSTKEDIPGLLLAGRIPSGLSVLVTLHGAPDVRSAGKMYLPAVDINHVGPFGELNYHAVIVIPASLALFFGSLTAAGYFPSLYRRPQRDVVQATEYSWSSRFWYLESRQDESSESRVRTAL